MSSIQKLKFCRRLFTVVLILLIVDTLLFCVCYSCIYLSFEYEPSQGCHCYRSFYYVYYLRSFYTIIPPILTTTIIDSGPCYPST